MRIDSHQHFWLYDAVKDAWINEEMAIIRSNFLPNDIAATLRAHAIDGVLAVQADQSAQETQFLLDLSSMYALIKGIVGWVDLQSSELEEQLKHYQQYPLIKGFRHIVEAESDPDFLMRPAVQQGIALLTKYGYTYDLLIRPRHYASTLACVAAHPGQRFNLNHIAKPAIKSKEYEEWAVFIAALAAYPNVYCKLSGLATEADWHHWKLDDFADYVVHVINCFGKKRIMFGSDWPVCLVAASYAESMQIVADKLGDFTETELADFWGENAVRFYNL